MALFTALALGALSGALQHRSQKKAAKRSERERRRALNAARLALSPDALRQRTAKLRGMFREDVATEEEPAIRATVARALGRSGAGDTGVGALLSQAARQAPANFAFSRALEAAQGQQNALAGLELGRLDNPLPERPDLFSNLLGGATQGAEGFSLFRGLR